MTLRFLRRVRSAVTACRFPGQSRLRGSLGPAVIAVLVAGAAAPAAAGDAPACAARRLEVQYLGGPTALLRYRGLTLLTDPTFDPAGRNYTRGPITLKKVVGPAVAAEQLPPIDVVLLSHAQHADNLDDLGRRVLGSAGTVLTTTGSARELGAAARGLAPGQAHIVTTPCGDRLAIRATPARHGPVGAERFAGEVVGFLVRDLSSGEDLVYATGDTVWFEGVAAVSRSATPRLVLAFAGAARTARGPFRLTMDASDVAEVAHAFPGARILPLHHDGWAHFTEGQDVLAEVLTLLGLRSRLVTVEPGAVHAFDGPLLRSP